MRKAFVNVPTEFRSRYLLGNIPTGVRNNDGWHRLEVKEEGIGRTCGQGLATWRAPVAEKTTAGTCAPPGCCGGMRVQPLGHLTG
jgi:hypothetical protein